VITGGGKWVEIRISADPLYQHLRLTAEKSSGAASKAASSLTCDVEPPQLRVAAVRIVDLSTSNAWGRGRTYATQMEALSRYRTGGEPKVTVQHVSVGEGGQAILGNVTQVPGETAGAAVPRLVRAVLQVAGGAWQEAVSDAWRRAGTGRAERESKCAQARPV
jgi:hypothetical protein